MNTLEYRNIAEQVLKNKEDILKHFQRDEVLADFGIRIIGQLATKEELPATAAEYGDAYAVGTESPFNYFIWTRANNLSAVDYWFEFGEIAIAGPQGPKGDRGAKGDTGSSTKWYFGEPNNVLVNAEIGSFCITREGHIYRLDEPGSYIYLTTIQGGQGPIGPKGPAGPQGEPGPQGPQGPTGDVGGFINIAGIVATQYALPDPELIQNLTVAYLVGTREPYDLYIQVGSTSAIAEWFNAGALNTATYVSVGGAFQNTWDADTKVDKVGGTATYDRIYAITKAGNQGTKNITSTPIANAIPQYSTAGRLQTNNPNNDLDCANKRYVDSNGAWKEITGSYDYISGSQSMYFSDSLRGHVISIVFKIAHRDFNNYDQKYSTISQPALVRLPARGLPAFTSTATVVSNADDFKNVSITFEVADNRDVDYDPLCSLGFTITNPAGADFQYPRLVIEYQDLGLMPEPQ